MKIFFNESTKILTNSSLSINQIENLLPSESQDSILKIQIKRGVNSDYETILFSNEVVDIEGGFKFNLKNSFTFFSANPITDDIKSALISKHKNYRNTVDRDQTEFLFELAPRKKMKN